MSWTYFTYQPIEYFFGNIGVEPFFTMLAFIGFVYIMIKELDNEKIIKDWKNLLWFFFAAIFGSLAGGRIWYYVQNWHGLETIITIFDLSKPGLTSFGMIIGGVLSILLFTYFYNKQEKVEKRWNKLFSKFLDKVALATALFVFIYRIGCFFEGCVPGTSTKLPWGMFAINFGNFSGTIMHPTALYLSFSGLLIFLFLNWYRGIQEKAGQTAWLFGVMYSFNRFWIEFLRAGTVGLNNSQEVLIIIFFICLVGFLVGRKSKLKA